jgi:hypothetical protein
MPVVPVPPSAFAALSDSSRASSEGSMRKMMTIRLRRIELKQNQNCAITPSIISAATIHCSRKNTNQLQTTELQRSQNKSLKLAPSSSCNRFFSINLSFKVSDMHQSVTLRFAKQLCLALRHLHAAALY